MVWPLVLTKRWTEQIVEKTESDQVVMAGKADAGINSKERKAVLLIEVDPFRSPARNG